MKNGPLFFAGIFASVAFSCAGIVLGSNAQLGREAGYYDTDQSQVFPARPSGLAGEGLQVYQSLNCAACHTQQVRRPDFGSDQARGWGDRQSVARDYIYRASPQLGEFRIGPDLANLGGRKPTAPDADDLLNLLYSGQGEMPSYRFLFERRKILGQPSDEALQLTGHLRPPAGIEIVPTPQARELAAYLLSLNAPYPFPEAKPAPAQAPETK